MKKIPGLAVLCIVMLSFISWKGFPVNIVVAQDGSGDYTTIGEAVNAVRAYSPVPVNVFIRNGIYKEKVVVPAWVTNITFAGESKENTIISFDDYSGKYMYPDTLKNKQQFSTFSSYTVLVHGNDVTMKDLTIRNTAGRVGQAVALHVDGDRFRMMNCRLLGNQDTLLTAGDSTRQYYTDCYIEGTTDFIFGPATAVFQNCTIKSLSDSYITAASTTNRQKYGYVFFNCRLIAAPEATKVYLGRPWRPYARTVFINCELGAHIRAEGWDNWRNPENEKTAFYAEYNNKGSGSAKTGRVPWSRQLTKKEARTYTIARIFGGTDKWEP